MSRMQEVFPTIGGGFVLPTCALCMFSGVSRCGCLIAEVTRFLACSMSSSCSTLFKYGYLSPLSTCSLLCQAKAQGVSICSRELGAELAGSSQYISFHKKLQFRQSGVPANEG